MHGEGTRPWQKAGGSVVAREEKRMESQQVWTVGEGGVLVRKLCLHVLNEPC